MRYGADKNVLQTNTASWMSSQLDGLTNPPSVLRGQLTLSQTSPGFYVSGAQDF